MIEKKIGSYISIRMGVVMSFTMSLVGSLLGVMGQRNNMPPEAPKPPFIAMWAPSFLATFALATVIAILIGFIFPMKKINDGIENAMKSKGFFTHLVQSIVSDLLYTPIISFAMAVFTTAVFVIPNAKSPEPMPLMPIALGSFVKSIGLEFAIALVVIMIVEPIIQKAAFKKYIPNFGQKVSGDEEI